MNFDELVSYSILRHKASMSDPADLIGQLPDGTPGMRQMCVKLYQPLFDRLETITQLFGVSKRQFVEAALYEAVNRAEDAAQASQAFGNNKESV